MARRVNAPSGEHHEHPSEDENLSDAPPIQGGTSGVVENAVDVLSEPGKATAAVPVDRREEVKKLPPIKSYRVVVGGRILYAGYHADIKVGKILDSTTHDLELLQRQGIKLQEV